MKAKILLPITFGLLGLIGCTAKPEYKTGKVLKESGSVTNLVQSSGAVFGNESVKIGTNYLLELQTKDGTYIADVKQNYEVDQPEKTIEGLALAIEEGDSVRFATTKGHPHNIDNALFDKDKIGTTYTSSMTLVWKHK
jgi:hypothetical protein